MRWRAWSSIEITTFQIKDGCVYHTVTILRNDFVHDPSWCSDATPVAPEFIAEFALAQDRAEADAIFVSCGALRTLEVIGEIETRAGKPAICSNQAMIWDCRRLAGIDDRFDGFGRLLAEF